MASAFLLDTHAAIWLLEGSPKLGSGARRALDEAETIAISDISFLEMALLAARGLVVFKPDVRTVLRGISEKLTVLPISPEIAVEATEIALPHRDPFDRIIAATARVHGLTLVSKDRQITEAKVVSVIW